MPRTNRESSQPIQPAQPPRRKARTRRRLIYRNPQLQEDVDEVVAVIGDEKAFRFKRPITVVHEEENGVHSHWCEELRLLGYGRSYTDSRDAFAGAFESLWENYVEASISELGKGALKLRGRIQKLVSEVEGVR